MYRRNEKISAKHAENMSKFVKEGDGGAKGTSRSGKCKISKRSKIEKCVDCFSAHGTHSEIWAGGPQTNIDINDF